MKYNEEKLFSIRHFNICDEIYWLFVRKVFKTGEDIMSTDRLSLYWLYFIIMSICAIVCAFLAISKFKIVKWELFYPKQQKWAQKHEKNLNIIVKKFFLLISIIYCLIGTLPSCLDLPYVLTANYKEVQGVVVKKNGMLIYLENGRSYKIGKVDWCETGDSVQLLYLPFTRYATITDIVEIEWFVISDDIGSRKSEKISCFFAPPKLLQ